MRPGNRVLLDLPDEPASSGMVLVIRSDDAVGVLCDDGTVVLVTQRSALRVFAPGDPIDADAGTWRTLAARGGDGAAKCERRAEIIRVATSMVLGHRLSRRHEPAVKVIGHPSLCAAEFLMDPAPLNEEEGA